MRQTSLALLLLAAPASAAPAPPRPVAFAYFSPLATAPAGKDDLWVLDIAATTSTGKVQMLTLTGVGKPGEAQHTVSWLKRELPALGWDCAADSSGKRLIFKAHKGSRVRSVEVSLKGLNQAFKPKVERWRPK
jgi:hypothetical protein